MKLSLHVDVNCLKYWYAFYNTNTHSDPEHTSIRISHLQSILANVRSDTVDGKKRMSLGISKSISLRS